MAGAAPAPDPDPREPVGHWTTPSFAAREGEQGPRGEQAPPLPAVVQEGGRRLREPLDMQGAAQLLGETHAHIGLAVYES